jgi:hypothetical protein
VRAQPLAEPATSIEGLFANGFILHELLAGNLELLTLFVQLARFHPD